MTEMFIFIALLLVIGAALEVTHRRVGRTWRPGLDTRNDRDGARLAEDLRAASQRDQEPPAAPIHPAAPRSAATDYRLVTRTAA